MSLSFENIENILWDGTEEQLSLLEGMPVSYSYSPKYGAFSIYSQKEATRCHGVPYTPSCVKLFGNEYAFGPGSCQPKERKRDD